jgi:acyl-CoA hydrolase
MNLDELYKKKKVSVDEAFSHIKSGDVIYHSLCAAEPGTLLSHVHTLGDKGIKNLHVITSMDTQDYPFNSDSANDMGITVESVFLTVTGKPRSRALAGLIPVHPHSIAGRVMEHRKPAVAFLSVSPMDSHGYLRCSLSQIIESDIVDKSRLIIAEVNMNMPLVYGDTAIHISQIDCLVEVDTPIPELEKGELEVEDKAAGAYAALLVNDGDTIQLGMGNIPDSVALALKDKHDLGVHTGTLSNNIVELFESGAVTGQRKSLHSKKIICTSVFGNKDLYKMINNNPSVEVKRASYVSSPKVIAQNDNMVSVNSCFAVDLAGQIASEGIGGMQYSGSNGASDFVIGAIHAKNGRSIIALRSTANNGSVSTIVPQLSPESVVAIQRNNVDYIVTEYGIARMKGKSSKERTANLIAVAHPDFRDELREAAKKLNLG